MELYKCPNCGKLFNKELLPSKCPNCGISFSRKKKRIWIVIIGTVIIGSIYVIHSNKSAETQAIHEQQTQEEMPRVQQGSNAYLQNESKPKTMADYEDIMKQNERIDGYRKAFNREIDLINHKASMGQYQGVMRQKLFWDANDAFDRLYYAGEELERLMRKHGFEREAREHERNREDFRREYERVKRETLR